MNTLLKEAAERKERLIFYRRSLHAYAETGFNQPKTQAFIKEELQKLGYRPYACGKSIVCEIGEKREVFLLRADTDALPIREKTGLPFACKNGHMHACGHDLHAAMLLGAATLLKDKAQKLPRKIRFLFQPAEEILEGAKNAVDAGALQDATGAMMLHVLTGVPFPSGTFIVSSPGVSAPSADYFRIRAKGKSAHGSMPHLGIDALTAAARILLALQEISARELALSERAVLTVGSLHAGNAGNVIADLAELNGTMRCFDETIRNRLKKRIAEISHSIAKAFRARAKIEFLGGCPALSNDEKLSASVFQSALSLFGKKSVFLSADLQAGGSGGGSEDFAYIAERVPSVMVALCAGERGRGFDYPLHHPKADFDESVLPLGAALLAFHALSPE